jgi:fatty acid desaturase
MIEQRDRNVTQIDYEGFARRVTALRRSILGSLAPSDFQHLKKVERWGRCLSLIGYLTAWIFPNPLSALALSHGNFTRWMIMHLAGHRAYDSVPGTPKRYTSKVFGLGWRRFIDWFDWIIPEAWNYEHNVLHHYHTGEHLDPDLVERHIEWLRHVKLPYFVRYLIIAALALTWKFTYYAPMTLFQLRSEQWRQAGHKTPWARRFQSLANPLSRAGADFWLRCVAPYGLTRFVIIPALFLPLGTRAALFVLINSLIAEAITNVHSFLLIAPNHTGDDLYRFDEPIGDKSEFYARQVLGSVNYRSGSDLIDYPQIWINYQIEHHLWPDLPMTKYRQFQEQTRALCEEFGIVYRQQPLFRRIGQMLDVMVGKRSMRRTGAISRPPQQLLKAG